jgi:hypothetical protein
MARDFEDIFNPDSLDDEELRALVRSELADHPSVDADSIFVTVEDGVVALSGRVGTEGERRIAEHILTDIIGLTDFRNELVVDPIRRDEEPEAIDDHLGNVAERSGATTGRLPDDEVGPEAEHLMEDLDARLYGTHDLQSAIERGTAWEPPDAPTQEGLSGMEDDVGAAGEDH